MILERVDHLSWHDLLGTNDSKVALRRFAATAFISLDSSAYGMLENRRSRVKCSGGV